MAELRMNDEEARTLKELLRYKLDDLEIEIRHTDHAEFRDLLKRRRQVLSDLCERIPESPGAAEQSQ